MGLHLHDVAFSWPDATAPLFDGVELAVPTGRVTALVGRSGCGKSTLLRIAAGLLEPSTGSVERDDDGRTGFVFQAPTLLPWRTLAENVSLPLELSEAGAAGDAVERALAGVGLSDAADKLPGALSGGMQMRASLARALVTRPSLLLMDEPFGALDALTRREAWAVTQRVWAEAEATVLLVTHDIDEAVLLADTVVALGGTPASVRGQVSVPLPRPRTAEARFDPAVAEAVRQVEAML